MQLRADRSRRPQENPKAKSQGKAARHGGQARTAAVQKMPKQKQIPHTAAMRPVRNDNVAKRAKRAVPGAECMHRPLNKDKEQETKVKSKGWRPATAGRGKPAGTRATTGRLIPQGRSS